MDYSIIVESNQEIAKQNYETDYGIAINDETNTSEFSNNRWKIKLPQSIPLNPGDKISYYSSMIKSKGVSDEGTELIGTANGNHELVDNKARFQLGYYVYNNWLNNAMLPLGMASLKSPVSTKITTNFTFREFNFQDTKHNYNVLDATDTNIARVFWSDYGGVSLETMDDWINNGSSSLYHDANELNAAKFGFNNTNTTATNNLCHYVPDTQRLYIGQQDWIGMYSNGYSSYHNETLSGTYSSKYDIIKSNADVETNLGFNSPIVIGNKITESMNNPNLEGNDTFINPRLINYTENLKTDTSLTSYKNYYDSDVVLQVEDETCKAFPTTFGKMITDINNGVENFSINAPQKALTTIAFPTAAQKIKYFYNCVASGDYKRTMAMSELYSNLNLSKNIQTLNINNLANTSFFSGSTEPDKNYPPTPPSTTKLIADNPSYPTSSPYDLGEQFCLFDNFDGAFSTNFDATEIAKITNNIIFRTDGVGNPPLPTEYETIKKPTTTDEYLNLTENQVFMTNMVANDDNFDKLKNVRDLLEKPSSDLKIDYTDQTFLDSLYYSLEVGQLDDQFSQSVYNMVYRDTLKPVENGIPLPVALPCVKSIADKLEPTDAAALSYNQYKNRMRLPIYAGLFCNEDNIKEKSETITSPNKTYNFTLLKEWRDNKMYEIDFHSRYNANRIPSSNTLALPTSTDFDFQDENGDVFNDTKIKENDLGVVVAYKNIIEDGDTALEFGLGSQPGASQFSLYSVDTTSNYSVNTGIFVNKSADSDLTKFGDNSVQTLTTNNTISVSQNTTNAFSETTNKQTISSTNAIAIEYESNKPFIPSEVELYQQASFPNPNASTEQSVLGAGVSLTQFLANNTNSAITPTNLFANSVLSRGFDNITGDFFKCLCLNNGNGPALLLVNFGDTGVQVEKFRIWARSDARNEMPRQMVIKGSTDGANYVELFNNRTNPFNTGTAPLFQGDYPDTTPNMVPSDNLNSALTRTLNNQAAYKYYSFELYENSGGSPTGTPITNGSYLIGELGLYTSTPDPVNNTSRFPKEIQIQGQQINSTTWTTLDTHSVETEPLAAGGATLPQNPVLTTLIPPIKEPFNQVSLSYKKLRLIITETFGHSQNLINIGEWVLRKRNNFTTYLGDASSPFSINDIDVKAYFPIADVEKQISPDPNTFVNFNPNNPNQKNAIRDGILSSDMDITLNTTNTYSTTANQVIIGENQSAGERIIGLEYKLTQSNPLGEVFNHFLIYTSALVSKLPFLPKDLNIFGIDEDDKQDLLQIGELATTQPSVATDVNLAANSPYGAKNDFNNSNTRYKSILITFKSTFTLSTNRLVIPDIIVSGYDSANHIVHNTPFIGFVCRNQISSVNKYRIPRPILGEHFGIPRSLQNNSLSFINSWERKVIADDRGVVVGDVNLIDGGLLKVGLNETGHIRVAVNTDLPFKTQATILLETEFYQGGSDGFATITGATLTNNGAQYSGVPILQYSYEKNAGGTDPYPEDNGAWVRFPNIQLTMGDFKTSYKAGTIANTQSQFPYMMIGSNDINVSFDDTLTRMGFNKLHTLMKEGQESNNLQRYYDGSMIFNSEKALISPDGESGNEVMKIHNKKTYCNSTRAGFTEAAPSEDFEKQIIPISNPAIRQKGIASGIGGVGILNIFNGKKDGTYQKANSYNLKTYAGTLFDKLGFNLKQLIPQFGQQNTIFNRGLHNKFIEYNDKPLSNYNSQVKPLTTNGLITSTLNQSLNTNNINYLIGSSDANNSLEKSVPQTTDSLIAENLPAKYSYSHILIYSNIIPKYNYVAAQKINKVPVIGNITRSYETGNIIYGNQPGIEYIVDKSYILSDIDVDLKTELGLDAPIDSGSTIVFKIDKKKPIPLELQEKIKN